MTTQFNMTRDINGYNGFGLMFSDDSYDMELAAGVAQSLMVPQKFSNCLAVFSFQPGTNIWVANNTTATVPAGSIATTASQMNPTARQVKGGDILSFITNDTTAEAGVSFYAA